MGFRLAFAAIVGLLPLSTGAQAPADELRTVAQVRGLTALAAARQLPVHLHGVVTFFDAKLYSRFIQDGTAGIYLLASTNTPPLFPGQEVEIEGNCDPGEFAPVILPRQVRILGQAPLPAARFVSYEQLASGKEDSQFVEIVGIVRSVQFLDSSGYYLVEVASGEGRLSVYTQKLPVDQVSQMSDRLVRIRGVCSTKFNRQRQLFSVQLMVPPVADLVLESPASPDPFAVPARSLGSLLQFNPWETYGHRIKVVGTVIYYEPGRSLILQDGNHGVVVQTGTDSALGLGDRVEALGFVGKGVYSPALQDAVFRKLSGVSPLQPVRLTPDQALMGTNDCQLVQVSGTVLDRAVNGTEKYLVLQNDGFIFHASLNPAENRDVFVGVENGSRVLVTGVCQIEPGQWLAGSLWHAKSFNVSLRSIADVRVIQPPPWWTLQRVLWIAGGVGAVALAALGWVGVLRRQVAERGRQLEIQIQERQQAEHRRNIEQERIRVAQDLHDELGSTLTEVSLLGTLARTPGLPAADQAGYLQKLTDASRSMVANLDEIVWAVNPKNDSVASLASYFSIFAQRFLNLAGIACRLQVAESFPAIPFDSKLRHGVFLAFKEALNNAVRHSRGTQILIKMEMDGRELRIAVVDNGRGFDPAAALPDGDGLSNMKNRLSQLGGWCDIKCPPAGGTSVEFGLPLAVEAA